MTQRTRKTILVTFAILALASGYFVTKLQFEFSLEQFFPEGDKDLEFFQEFTKEFENDLNFLLIAVERKDGVFEKEFLEKFHDFTLKVKEIPEVTESMSLTKVAYPLKTPFTITSIPAIHIDKPERYEKDKKKILADERFAGNLISKDATSLVITLKTVTDVQIEESEALIIAVEKLVQEYHFEDYHLLGPANFTKEMVRMQKREIIVSTLVSGLLVCVVMFWIFRMMPGVTIALASIGLGLLLFFGLLGAIGRPMNAMAALYPVLMVIVGTSDVVHIMTKYIDENKNGKSKSDAIKVAIKEIGLATLLTSLTTAIGFISLATSKLGPIKAFGWNAALGVLVAYITVIFFTTALLSMYRADQLIKFGKSEAFWNKFMDKFYHFTKNNPRQITIGFIATLLLCFLGISNITTNYRIESNLPTGAKMTEDFLYFEKEFSGFRPIELAVFTQGEYNVNDFEVLQEIDKVEKHLASVPSFQGSTSITSVYKSINQMYNGNRASAYKMPSTEKQFKKYQKVIDKIPQNNSSILVSKDGKKARISTKTLDIGADSVKVVSQNLDAWIAENMNPQIATFKQTGTGLILDKNSEYVRTSLLQGLGGAILIVSILMALLFKNIRMLVISLIPNIVPLLLAGALLGFLQIELEAGISIIFAVVFGIAVDDTIHFLSKYKLARNKGLDIDAAIHITFMETGKAICLTTVILFFGFLVLLFSIHPPSVTVGLLISVTLVSALFGDLLLIPILIRWLYKDDSSET